MKEQKKTWEVLFKNTDKDDIQKFLNLIIKTEILIILIEKDNFS